MENLYICGIKKDNCVNRKGSRYGKCMRYRKVFKYDIYGHLVGEYPDMMQAASDEEMSIVAMRKLLKGEHRVSRKGFVFRWEELS